jgi:hypothetical protein
MLIRRLLPAVALFALLTTLSACSNRTDTDSLAKGHESIHLRKIPCDPAATLPSVNGAAGVHHDPDTVYIEDWVLISVCRFDTLAAEAEKAQKPISLYVQGLDSGLTPTGIDYDNGILTFTLYRNEKNKEIFRGLLYGPLDHPSTSMALSAGVAEGRPLPRAPKAPTILRLHKLYVDWTVLLWALLLTAVFAALLYAAAKSDLLRDGPTIGGTKQTFSLARTQMAWWFFLILVGYVFIWLVTGDRDTIPASLLGLMGISAATALAAVAISARGTAGTSAKKKLYDDELAAIETAVAELDAQIANSALSGIKASLEKKREALLERKRNIYVDRAGLTTVSPSKTWWRDLITDDNGAVGLDRIQVLVWTMVLGFIFLQAVLWDLSMPEFSTTLLALMGISSGTYIGFKLPGKSG